MSHGGVASMQNYNTELVRCLDELREKREALNKTILAEEAKKAEIQRKLEKLTSQLHRVNDSLALKQAAKNDYDTTIQETEAAYEKIVQSSQTLLHVLKRETVTLGKVANSHTTTSTASSSVRGSGNNYDHLQQHQQQQQQQYSQRHHEQR